MFIQAWRNYAVTTPINVESNSTTLSCIKGIFVALMSAAGEEERQLSSFSQPACCMPGLHKPWVLPDQYVNQVI